MTISLPIIIITGLIITILVEISLAFLLKVREKYDFLNIILVNFLTNPLVVTIPFYINIKYGLIARNIVLYILEIGTVLVEGRTYKKNLEYKKINPYCLSLILNFSSYFIGVIINNLIYG